MDLYFINLGLKQFHKSTPFHNHFFTFLLCLHRNKVKMNKITKLSIFQFVFHNFIPDLLHNRYLEKSFLYSYKISYDFLNGVKKLIRTDGFPYMFQRLQILENFLKATDRCRDVYQLDKYYDKFARSKGAKLDTLAKCCLWYEERFIETHVKISTLRKHYMCDKFEEKMHQWGFYE